MSLAIRNILVIDGTGAKLERATVVVDGDRIAAVGPDSRIKVPRGSRVNAGHWRALLPGLIDCHVHYCLDAGPDAIRTLEQDGPTVTAVKAVAHARATLEAGITTVRDVGSREHISISVTHAIKAGIIPCPRTLNAGLVICMPGWHAWFIRRQADGPAETVKAGHGQLRPGRYVI